MKRFIPLLVILVLFVPAVSSAYVPSPQYGALEIKFGPYFPNVDENPTVDGMYARHLGNDRMFLTTIELDWQFYRVPGVSFGVGGSLGFMQGYDKAEVEGTGETSSDYNVLNVMPFALLAVVRIDALADLVGVPLVPYLKMGLAWYLWWTLHAGKIGEFDNPDPEGENEKAVGGTLGWQFNFGLAFRLDWLDEMSARTFDNEVGVNHSYLFFEFLVARIEGFGRNEYMWLSPKNFGHATFQAGLCLEF